MVGKGSNSKRRRQLPEARHLYLFYTFAQTLCNDHCAVAVCLGQDYHKFVAAESRRRIDSPQSIAQSVRQHAKRNIASLVTGSVVDLFEMIEVEHDQGKRLARASGHLEILFEA